MKTPLGTEVDLGPGHIVLDGVPAPAKGAHQPPSFRPMSTAELLYICDIHRGIVNQPCYIGSLER